MYIYPGVRIKKKISHYSLVEENRYSQFNTTRCMIVLTLGSEGVFQVTGLPSCVYSVFPEPLPEPGAVLGAEGEDANKTIFHPGVRILMGGVEFMGEAGLEIQGKSTRCFKAMSQEKVPEGNGGRRRGPRTKPGASEAWHLRAAAPPPRSRSAFVVGLWCCLAWASRVGSS